MKRRYWVYIYKDPEEPDVLAVPGVHSDGDTRKEAIGNILEALEGMLDALQGRGLPIPEPEGEWVEVEVKAA